MIGTLPMSDLAPLDYRYALDAAVTLLGTTMPSVRCAVPPLQAEIAQRWPAVADEGSAALWVEPLQDGWQKELDELIPIVPAGAPLVIIASRPLARLLPERAGWPGRPLGLHPLGLLRLIRAAQTAGFALEAAHGIHTLPSIAFSQLSQIVGKHRPALGDRLHFAARLRYRASGPLAHLSTVALLATRKEPN